MLDRVSDGELGYLELLGKVKVALASSREVAVDVSEARPYAGQPRQYFDEAAILRLAESIDASGQTTAGIIRRCPGPTEYELIDGERRWRAVRTIPVERRPLYRARLIEADDSVVQYLISGIANFNREGHGPLETCDAICRLVGFGLPMTEAAALLGLHYIWAGQIHGLRRLVPAVRDMLAPGLPARSRLPTTAAIEISKCAEKLQLGLAQRVMGRSVTMADLRTEVVRVSKEAGTYVQTRVADPNQRWRSVNNQVAVAERAARVAHKSIGAHGMSGFVARRPVSEIEVLENRLRAAREYCEQIEQQLVQWRGERGADVRSV